MGKGPQGGMRSLYYLPELKTPARGKAHFSLSRCCAMVLWGAGRPRGTSECFGVILDLLVHLPNITCPPSSTPLHRLGGGQAAHPPTGRLPRPKASLVHVMLPAAAVSAAPLLLAPLLCCCRLRCSTVAVLAASTHPHPSPCAAPSPPVQPGCSQSSPWKKKGHCRKERGPQLGREGHCRATVA